MDGCNKKTISPSYWEGIFGVSCMQGVNEANTSFLVLKEYRFVKTAVVGLQSQISACIQHDKLELKK